MEPRRLELVLFASLPTLLLLALGGAALEALLRARHADVSEISGVSDWQIVEEGGLTYGWDAYHPTLGWTNAPGWRSDASAPYAVTINGQGLRAPRDYAPEPPPGRLRVAVFGDSMVFGEEVDDDQTVPHHLERALDGSEVLNFGVHGYGPGQAALRLELDGFALQPERVVVAQLTFALLRDALEQYVHQKPVFRARGGELEVGNVPVPRRISPWLRHSYAVAWLWDRVRRLRQRAGFDEALDTTRAVLTRMRDACRERGVPLVLVHLIDGYTIERMRGSETERRRVERVREAMAASGVDWIDLAPGLEALLAERGRSLLAPHGHWSGEGNRWIAERIAERLTVRLRSASPRCAPATPACGAAAAGASRRSRRGPPRCAGRGARAAGRRRR